MGEWLLYGATGYTGRLVTLRAVERGLKPILAGRNAEELKRLAAKLNLHHVVVGLDDPAGLRRVLKGVAAVLHCAGPFVHTSSPMVQACLEASCHYLDITGEVAVFERLRQQDQAAQAAGVMLLPGVGFDVVPSDCLALHLKLQLPSATHFTLAFRTQFFSSGTLATALEHLGQRSLVRRDGHLVEAPASLNRTVDFGDGPTRVSSLTWGDLVTAFHSTGIPNIEVFTAMDPKAQVLQPLGGLFEKLLRLPGVKPWVQHRIRRMGGPDETQRKQGVSQLWAEVQDLAGNRRAALLFAPEAYTLTALIAAAVMGRVLLGNTPLGFQTPATAFGADFILEIPGVQRRDI